MSKFKVGDRVRRIEYGFGSMSVGSEGVVEKSAGNNVTLRGHDWKFNADFFELVTPAFTITPGKFYRTASGAVTGRVTKGDTGFEAVVDGKVRIFDAAGGAVHGGDDIVEEWVPKVGERVVFTDVCDAGWWFGPDTKSKEGTVSGPATCYSSEYQFDVSVEGEAYPAHVKIDHIEPLPVAAEAQPAATLKIEAGRYYRTRDGRKVGPMRRYDSDSWVAPDCGRLWTDDGQRYFEIDRGGPSDLIAEWQDAPTAPVSAQVDAIAEEYGPAPANDNGAKTSDITISLGLDTGNFHEELDEIIAKLKKVRKLQRQVGLAA